MAIDTANKRNSAMLEPGQMPWPPDGAISADDRLVMLEFYSGIPAGSTPTPPVSTPIDIRVFAMKRTIRVRPMRGS